MSVPLLRGSGAHIVTEPLTQAERDVLYAIWEFERFKRTFAVNIAGEYLEVLQGLDEVANEEANYRRVIMSVRRSRRLTDSGDMDVIQMDQAVQDELRARNRWILAIQSYERSLGSSPVRMVRVRMRLTGLWRRDWRWITGWTSGSHRRRSLMRSVRWLSLRTGWGRN